MKNSERFLNLYNEIDDFIRDVVNNDRWISFYRLIDTAGEKDKVVRQYSKKLKKYGNLRNAIVHDNGEQVIAEPNEFAITELEDIIKKIKRPKLVYDICKHKVEKLSVTDSFDKALNLMKENDFSQLPIYKEGIYFAVLNTETISSWLRNNIVEDIISIKETTIKNVIDYSSSSDTVIFKSKETTVIELIEEYKTLSLNQKKIDAFIVTQSGKRNEEPLTIITNYDIPNLLENI